MLLAQIAFALNIHVFWGIVASLFLYFVAFNILEASLPSLISKMAPVASKGTAMGVHNTAQSLGMFLGAVIGGYLSHKMGFAAVFVFCAVLMGVWLVLALGMKTPPSVKTKMYHVGDLTEPKSRQIENAVKNLTGVVDATLIAQEHNLIVKIDNQQTKAQQANVEQSILNLIGSA